jgi:selenium-binding protein 1
LLSSKYGHRLHAWDLKRRKHLQEIDLGPEHQLVLELRPARDPSKSYGFAGVVISLKDLSSSIWLWHKPNGAWAAKKIIEIPAQPADPDQLPPLLKGFKAVPPLLSDINLSLDDKSLYASCWGTGEMHRYDVSDPHNPKLTATLAIGGIAKRSPHPASGPVNGGPQMVEVSRDGRRVYFTNSLYGPWDKQFYPDGISGWMVKADAGEDGSLTLDPNFYLPFDAGYRPHQVRLEGGDSSSDSYCYP